MSKFGRGNLLPGGFGNAHALFARTAATISILLLPLVSAAELSAAEAPVTDCDRLAAHPTDPSRVADGVYWEILDGQAASHVCERAVRKYPNSLRLIFQLGRAYLRQGRQEEGFPYLHEAASKGYLVALATLGGMYQYNLNDYAEALKWYQRGAALGSVSAMAHLGDMYAAGVGVQKDPKRAFDWYVNAAKRGYALAENNVGWFYEEGFVGRSNKAEALRWYKRAAVKGFMRAQFNVGRFYHNGITIRKNMNKTVEWYTRAAQQGYSYAQVELGKLYENGQVDGRPNYEEAFYWYRLASTSASRSRQRDAVKLGRRGAARVQKRLENSNVVKINARVTEQRKLSPEESVASLQPTKVTFTPVAANPRPVKSTPEVTAPAKAPVAKQPVAPPTGLTPLNEDYVVLADVQLSTESQRTRDSNGETVSRGQLVLALARDEDNGTVLLSDGANILGYVETAAVAPLSSTDALVAMAEAEANAKLVDATGTGTGSQPVKTAAVQPEAKAQTAPRDDTPTDAAPVATEFGTYHALVIGNNDYEILPSLRTAINDAEAVAGILEKVYGFKVTLLKNATRNDIVGTLDKMRQELSVDDNLLIYYAGHGILDAAANRGFWLPVEASDETMVQWVSTVTVTDALKAMEAKHVLVVVDSCYSGALTRNVRERRKSPEYYKRLAEKRTRVVLTSGGLEPVADSVSDNDRHSVFAKALLDALKENDGIMEAAELFNQVRRPVMLNAPQTPEFGDIRFAGHEGGDFIFQRVN